MKRAFLIILLISSLISIAACKSGAVPIETANEDVITISQIQFDMNLDEGTMDVIADYKREDISETFFLLNRDFVVTKIVCDGEPVEIAPEIVFIDDGEYEIKQYRLPDFEEAVHIEYTGTLSGKTGIAPYVRERITLEFTYLRWETFFHPLFASAESINADILEAFLNPIALEVTVNMPKEYVAHFIQNNVNHTETNDGVSFSVSGELIYEYIAIAIAKYKHEELESGNFYFLENTDVDKAMKIVAPTMAQTHGFMNRHFGEVEFRKKIKIVEVPANFGQFAIPEEYITFAVGTSFQSVSNMGNLIHEFIHLGWNAKTENFSQVQQSRFFSEAFTSYFTYRVMADITGSDARWRQDFTYTYGHKLADLVPIKEYGNFDTDLNYTLGALCLYRLSELMGIEVFDQATKEFLDKYRDNPVDFDLFTSHYIEACDNPNVEDFFQRWIYSDAYKDEIFK